MLGNILYGGSTYADTNFGISQTEVGADISQSTSRVVFRSTAVFSSLPHKPRIPELDIFINSTVQDERFITGVSFGSYGTFEEWGTELQAGIGFGSSATFINPEIIASGPNRLAFGSYSIFDLEHPDENAIAWANIGTVDFEIKQDNVAGKMPVAWSGYVYSIEQLNKGDLLYVYGANGISVIKANGIFYGMKQVSPIGIKSKHAVINTNKEQYFITVDNEMFKITQDGKRQFLGYQEFLATLGDVMMSYDSYEEVIYICDGVKGYVYGIESDSFGLGPSNITCIHHQDGVKYVGAPDTIAIPDFEIVTDIYDMGTKKEKTVFNIMLSVNDTTNLKAGVDFRLNPNDSFVSSPLINVSPQGTVEIPCYGREFRFRFSGNTGNENFKIDMITINGVIAGVSPLDTISFS